MAKDRRRRGKVIVIKTVNLHAEIGQGLVVRVKSGQNRIGFIDFSADIVRHIEYGVGFNTPTIIRYPFERMAASYPDVTLIRINKDHRDCQTPGIMHFIGLETI